MSGIPGRVVVVTKAPRPGFAKTRLAPALGFEGAAELHRRFVDHTLALVEASGLPVTVALGADPDGRFAEELRGRGLHVVAQCAGDLGDRMRSLVAPGGSTTAGPTTAGPTTAGPTTAGPTTAGPTTAERRVLIGTDCPLLVPSWLGEAVSAPCPVAIAPSEDGGYWAISVAPGVSDSVLDALFSDMPWSTDQVFSTTLSRLSQLGVAVTRLPTAWDIDEPADLVRLLADPGCPAVLRSHLSRHSPPLL